LGKGAEWGEEKVDGVRDQVMDILSVWVEEKTVNWERGKDSGN